MSWIKICIYSKMCPRLSLIPIRKRLRHSEALAAVWMCVARDILMRNQCRREIMVCAVERSRWVMCRVVRARVQWRCIWKWNLVMTRAWTPWAVVVVIVRDDRSIFRRRSFTVYGIRTVVAVAIAGSRAHDGGYQTVWRFRQLNVVVVVIVCELIHRVRTFISIQRSILIDILGWRVASIGRRVLVGRRGVVVMIIRRSSSVVNWVRCIGRSWVICGLIWGVTRCRLIRHLMDMRWVEVMH